MKTQRWWIPVALLAILGLLASGKRPEAAAQGNVPPVGRYQISASPGRPPQFGMEAHGTGCYLVDTANGELWVLSTDGQQKSSWKRITDPVR